MSDYVTGELIPAKNGVLRDAVTGKIVSAKNATNAITKENSSAYHRARKEKTQAAIRAAIARASGTQSSIAAIAVAAESIWQGVLDPEQDLDKRRKAWLSVGRQAGLIDDTRQTLDNDTVQSLAIADSLLAVRDIIHDLTKSNGTV